MITGPTLLVTIILCVFIMSAPRRYVLSIYVIGMCFLPSEQAVVIAGLDFKVLRIFALVGIFRIFIKNEKRIIRLNRIDQLFIAWCVVGSIAFSINIGTSGAFINRLGYLVDLLCLYYIFRVMVRDFKDLEMVLKSVLLCTVFMTPFVFIEYLTGRNPFVIFGGLAESKMRGGRLRCSGAFSHAILLGSFAASVFPIAIFMAKRSVEKSILQRRIWLLSSLCALFIVFASASSGPVLALLGTIVVTLAFRYRQYVGKFTYSVIGLLVVLHSIMSQPVWHLAARIDVAGGSTGYHRYKLINETIINFSDWAWVGTSHQQIVKWGVFAGDVTSMYIAQAVWSGFATFLIFVIMFVVICRAPWKLSLENIPRREQFIIWGLFASYMAHAISFMSVAYTGQILMMLTLSVSLAAYLKMYHERFRREMREERIRKQLEKANGVLVDDR